jgi:hypothetical protein
MGRGLQPALNLGPSRENALMVDITTTICAAANARS